LNARNDDDVDCEYDETVATVVATVAIPERKCCANEADKDDDTVFKVDRDNLVSIRCVSWHWSNEAIDFSEIVGDVILCMCMRDVCIV
jgi:hypothetical protein